MSRIMELADAYAGANTHARSLTGMTEARAALQAEVSELEKDAELVVLQGKVNKQLIEDLFALREKLALVEKDAARLWMLLDDVDTADDIAKADDKLYRSLCQQYQTKRWEIMSGERIDAAMEATK